MGIQVYASKTPYRWDKEIDHLQFIKGIPGGYLTSITNLKRDLRFKYKDLELWEEIIIRDGNRILWQGPIAETPKQYPNTIQVNGVGPWQSLSDDKFGRIYCDTSYSNWEPIDVSNEAGFGKLQFEGSNNQFLFKLPNGIANSNTYWYTHYQKLMYIGQQVHRVTFDWATGADYDSTEQALKLYAKTGGSTDTLWTAPTGAGSGSQDITLGTKRDYVFFAFHYVGAKTGIDDNYWGQITNPKVYGYHDSDAVANVYASEVIQEVVAARCPLISVDNTDISATTYTIEPLVLGMIDAQSAINEVNKYHNYNVGVRGKQLLNGTESSDGKPAVFFYAHDDTIVHYQTDKEHCKLNLSGKSIENCYNRVIVNYVDANGITRYVTVTATDGYIEERKAAGALSSDFYRTLVITADTTSSTKATQVADTALAEVKNLRAKGTCTIIGTVQNQYGAEIPVHYIEPGYNIRIRDIETTEEMFDSSDVRDAANTFKITKVTIDYNGKSSTATLELDNPGGQLDVLLARLMKRVVGASAPPPFVPDPPPYRRPRLR